MEKVFCLKGGVDQSEEDRKSGLSMLKKSVPQPGSKHPEGEERNDEVLIEEGLRARRVLDLVASRKVVEVCVVSPEVLAVNEEDVNRLETFLSENRVALTVTETKEPSPIDEGDRRESEETAEDKPS